MAPAEELLASEKRLCAADLDHYRRICRPDAVFIMPGMSVSLDDAIAGLERSSPWDRFQLEDVRVRELGAHAAAIIYRFHGVRGDQRYSADMVSTYVQAADDWQLVTHQQTPV